MAEETAIFCIMLDKFFDALNVSHTKGVRQQKIFQLPYPSSNDFCLKVCQFIHGSFETNIRNQIHCSGFKTKSCHI